MKNHTFKKYERLHNRKNFIKLFQNGKKVYSKYFLIYYLANELEYSRIAVVVKKKFGKAVERNKIKRRIREIYRCNKSNFRQGIDMIIFVSENCKNLDFINLRKELIKLSEKIK